VFDSAETARQGEDDHYVVLDLKFTSNLEDTPKAADLAYDGAQVRLYTYMLAWRQQYMPKQAYIITRDHIYDPYT